LTEAAWKVAQRRLCRAWGFQTGAWRGESGSDGRGDGPVSLEVKRAKRRSPQSAWIEQAIDQGRREHRPWILVVVGHNDRSPIAVVDHAWLLDLYQRAHGLLRESGEAA
jgi:hypothetical protein